MTDRLLTITIFGADGLVGRETVRQALGRGHAVQAVERTWPPDTPPREGATLHTADVLEDDLAGCIGGSDAVISCLGVGNDLQTLMSPPPLYTRGTARIREAMHRTQVGRLIVISASFVAAQDRGPIWFRLPAMTALSRIFAQMKQMEAELRQDPALDWTAVRPGWLMEGPRTGDATIQADVIPKDMLRTRHGDLASFLVDLAGNREWVHQTPAIARPERLAAISPQAVLEEMLPS